MAWALYTPTVLQQVRIQNKHRSRMRAMKSTLPLLALPAIPVGDDAGLTHSERAMLKRTIMLGELQRLQAEKEPPSGAPASGKWRLRRVVKRFGYVEDTIVYIVPTNTDQEVAYNQSGDAVKIATPEDETTSTQRGRAFRACLILIFLCIASTMVVVFVVTSNVSHAVGVLPDNYPTTTQQLPNN